MPGVQWRDPDLHEVIEFLQNPNSVIKANAAAYLQHLCYMDDPVKTKTRQLGGIPPLVALLSHDSPEIHRNACGALRYDPMYTCTLFCTPVYCTVHLYTILYCGALRYDPMMKKTSG